MIHLLLAAKVCVTTNITPFVLLEAIDLPNKINIVLVIITAISVLVTIWSVRVTKTIAAKSGAFAKGALSLYLGEFALTDRSSNSLTIGCEFRPDSVTKTSMPLLIKSNGERTLDDVFVSLRYRAGHNVAIDTGQPISGKALLSVERTVERGSVFDDVIYKLPHLHPGVKVELADPVLLNHETVVRTIVDATTKDGVAVKIPVTALYSLEVFVTIVAKDFQSIQLRLNISAIACESYEDLVKKYLKITANTDRPQPKRRFPKNITRILGWEYVGNESMGFLNYQPTVKKSKIAKGAKSTELLETDCNAAGVAQSLHWPDLRQLNILHSSGNRGIRYK